MTAIEGPAGTHTIEGKIKRRMLQYTHSLYPDGGASSRGMGRGVICGIPLDGGTACFIKGLIQDSFFVSYTIFLTLLRSTS